MHQYKFGKSKWYQQQIQSYLQQHPEDTAKHAFKYFNNGDCPWTNRTFCDHYYRMRNILNRDNNTNTSCAPLTPNQQEVINNPTTGDINNIITELRTVINQLHNKTDKVSVKTKQILVSAISTVDNNGTLTNSNTIKYMYPNIHHDTLNQCAINKYNFNTSNTNFLYNNQTCGDQRTRNVYQNVIDLDIIKYWITNTTPDPNTRKGRILTNEFGEKYKHPYHYCHHKYKDVYSNWIVQSKQKYQKLPCLAYFMQLKPCYVCKVKPGNYSQCMKCYNFQQMTKAILKRLSIDGSNYVGDVMCDNYDFDELDENCKCSECLRCSATIEAMKKSPLRLMQYLCCDNDDKYPDLKCIEGRCENPSCGVTKIQHLFDSKLININPNCTIGFKQIVIVPKALTNGKSRNCHATIHDEYTWRDLKKIYVNQLRDFMVHHNCWLHQHQTRRDFVDKTTGKIPSDSVYCHFDFINNIPVQYSTMELGAWGDGETVSYMVSYDRFRNELDYITEQSYHYLCDDKKHDWSAAIVYIKQHLLRRCQEFRSKYKRSIRQFICYSDQGEFKCSGFLYKLGCIANELGVTIVWNFTCSGHSKGKHDGEGHVTKTEYRQAVTEDKVQFNIRSEPYSVTLCNYMNVHFDDQGGDHSFDRQYFSIAKDDINHIKSSSVVRTMSGISKYHCFVIKNTKYVWYRKLSCHCTECTDGLYTQCRHSSICGPYSSYTWIKPNHAVKKTQNNNNNRSRQQLLIRPPALPQQFNYNLNHNQYNRHRSLCNVNKSVRYNPLSQTTYTTRKQWWE